MFRSISKRNESNLKEEEKIKTVDRGDENSKRRKNPSFSYSPFRSIPNFLPIFSRKSWRKDVWSVEGGEKRVTKGKIDASTQKG